MGGNHQLAWQRNMMEKNTRDLPPERHTYYSHSLQHLVEMVIVLMKTFEGRSASTVESNEGEFETPDFLFHQDTPSQFLQE